MSYDPEARATARRLGRPRWVSGVWLPRVPRVRKPRRGGPVDVAAALRDADASAARVGAVLAFCAFVALAAFVVLLMQLTGCKEARPPCKSPLEPTVSEAGLRLYDCLGYAVQLPPGWRICEREPAFPDAGYFACNHRSVTECQGEANTAERDLWVLPGDVGAIAHELLHAQGPRLWLDFEHAQPEWRCAPPGS